MFVAFAPRENPKIAIAVAIENAGYGATWAAPIASLLIEKYLKDSVSVKRKAMEDKMLNAHLINKYTFTIDSVLRLHDAEVFRARMEKKFVADSTQKAQDSSMFAHWVDERLRNISKQKLKSSKK